MERKSWLGLALISLLFLAGARGADDSRVAQAREGPGPGADATVPGRGWPDSQDTVTKRYPVQIEGQWGYIDRSGSVEIEPSFQEAASYVNGLARVKKGGLYGYIDPDGEWVIEPQFEGARDFGDGLAPVVPEGEEKWGYVDRSGRLKISPRFPQAWPFSEGLAPVDTAGPAAEGNPKSWGYIDTDGELAIAPQFAGARHFSGGLAPVRTGGLGTWGFIDTDGEIVIEPTYQSALPFSEGLAAVNVADVGVKWTYIDRQGNRAIEETFREAYPFSEGLAFVKTAFEWRVIDTDGNTKFQLEDDEIDLPKPYRGGLAQVAAETGVGGGRPTRGGPYFYNPSDPTWIYLDREGEVVWPPDWEGGS